ncbi:hypothetical protein AXF42_Ash003869 [Apostasia shenzhenica]|uniref:Uncharacterized protein n=1 Tax=Apostasia shenzhenica TaxID=1088818 RepID=A0A2I0AI50_9ASPA|nr:hypothetical protein AXF42_Ash003869 [Apostasia shenzhenica]
MLIPRQGTEAIETFYAEYSDFLGSNIDAEKASIFTTLQDLFSLYYSEQVTSRNVQVWRYKQEHKKSLTFNVLKLAVTKRSLATEKEKAASNKSTTQSQALANLNELQFYLHLWEKFDEDMSLLEWWKSLSK